MMRLKTLLKQNRLVYAAAKRLRCLPYPFLRLFMRGCHALGVDGRKVYFSSFNGMLYNENPKYVCEALLRLCPEAKLIFRLNAAGMAQADIPPQVKRVKQNSPAALYHMATSRVIVKNARFKPWMLKFSNQRYIQLWHGDRGLKKILLDANPSNPERILERKYMDIGVSASEMGSRIYMRRAFGFDGELMECGYPKNDILVHPPQGLAEEVRRELGLPEGTRFLLYAPTFRDQNSGAHFDAAFSLERLRAALEAASGEKWMILTRGHSLNCGVKGDGGRDVSAYADVSRLLLLTDMLVTDYSSIAGDFMLLDRPIILYHADRSAYTSKDRELIFEPEASPYIIVHNEEELIIKAQELAKSAALGEENCRALRAFYGVRESGHASEAVARRIMELLELD